MILSLMMGMGYLFRAGKTAGYESRVGLLLSSWPFGGGGLLIDGLCARSVARCVGRCGTLMEMFRRFDWFSERSHGSRFSFA